ncbi:MAG: type IV secretion protein IcmL [Coxiella sp. (in: Bacteria)]|nr:MAG: type IV secretion protein IcmL [Coxiella sp. (in: g-proteobacteria)]
MSIESQELEYQKNNLYRDHYRIALGATLFMGLICGALAVIMVLMSLGIQQPKYYATTTTGDVIPLQSLSEPVVTKPYLLQWASLATRAAYNLDFNNYQQQIAAAAPYFTADGFLKFKEALKSTGLLDTMIKKKLIMSAIVSGDPVIIRDYISHGRHAWNIQLPLMITFQSASAHTIQHVMVSMKIQRVPVLSAEKGIQISDFRVG